MKPTKPSQGADVGPAATAAVSKQERKTHIGAVRAADVFQVRTGIDPRLDTIILMAAGVSVFAELIEQVRHLTEWFEPTRKAARGQPPAWPDWIETALGASSPAHAASPPAAVVTFGQAAGIAPGKQVDLALLTARVAEFRSRVLEVADLGKVLAKDLDQTWGELTIQQPVLRGGTGAFREPRKRGTQRDEARWRFLNRLHRMWAQAGRGALAPTETGLLAVYVGLDDGKMGLDGVVKRWSEMIQQAKRGTAP